MELGDRVPDISLISEAGISIKPGEVIGFQSLLVLFYSSECPFSRAYSKRLSEIFEYYHDEDLRTFFVNLNPENKGNDPVMSALKASGAVDRNFLIDSKLEAAKWFNVRYTPAAYLFNRERNLVYQGAIDDNWNHPELVTRVYLEDALEYALDALEIDFPEITPVGTPIQQLVQKAGNK